MQFIPYLDFDGNARQAFDFYAKAFNGLDLAAVKKEALAVATAARPGTDPDDRHPDRDSTGSVRLFFKLPATSGR